MRDSFCYKKDDQQIKRSFKRKTLPQSSSIYEGGDSRVYYIVDQNPKKDNNSDSEFKKNDPILNINYGIVQHKLYSQFFTINMHSHDHLTQEEKYILKSYIKIYDYYISFTKNLNNQDNFYHIEKDNKFSHGLYVNDPILIFGTFNLFKPNDEIVAILKESIKIIKQNESNFFVSLK